MSRVKLINDISIGKKLWLLNIVGVFLPILLLFLIFFIQIYREYEERESLLVDESINRVIKNFNNIFDSASDITYSYLSDKYISDILNDATIERSFDALVRFHDIEDRIQADVNTYKFIDDIIIYHHNEAIAYSGHTQYLSEETIGDWGEKFLDSNGSQAVRVDDVDKDSDFYFVRKLNAFSYNSKDYVEVKLNNRIMKNQFLDESLLKYKAVIYIIDEQDKVIITNAKEVGDIIGENIEDMIVEDSSTLVVTDLNADYYLANWKMVVSYNNELFLKALRDKLISLILIAMIILFFSSLLVRYISSSISTRLKIIDDAMTQSEEDKLILVAENLGRDEIGHTANRYNEMVRNTKELIEEVESGRIRAHTLLAEKTKAYEEIKVQSTRIHNLIYMDALTGLKNRFAITNEIDDLLVQTVSPYTIAIMFLDIDNFKNINDTFGHGVGDQVIKATGELISEVESDCIGIGRFGGDEFIITMKSSDLTAELDTLLERIEKIFENAIVVGSNKFYLSFSIGITRYPENGNTKEDLIKKADQALYQAKDRGKNQFVLYDEAFNVSFEEKVKLQSRIKAATKNKDFHLNYQPYIASDTKEIKGFEALIRWDTHGDVQVSPYELITTAEEMGIIIELGEWITEEACKFIKRVNKDRARPITISINISAVQLMHKEFTEKLVGIVESVGVNPEEIYLEITETMLLDSINKGISIIDQLKTLGFGISLDDFGTGYSSLSYFKELPVTILKIDKSFVDDVVDDYYNKELIGTIVKIAHNRQVLVTAEGVEEKKQLDYLTAEGVDMIQGYYYSKPLNEKDAIEFLNNSDLRERIYD